MANGKIYSRKLSYSGEYLYAYGEYKQIFPKERDYGTCSAEEKAFWIQYFYKKYQGNFAKGD